MMKALIIEDDHDIVEAISLGLQMLWPARSRWSPHTSVRRV